MDKNFTPVVIADTPLNKVATGKTRRMDWGFANQPMPFVKHAMYGSLMTFRITRVKPNMSRLEHKKSGSKAALFIYRLLLIRQTGDAQPPPPPARDLPAT